MGRYFELNNHTQHHNVSGPWKSNAFCDCHRVMHQLKWESTDSITSTCYDEECTFVFNEKSNVMDIKEDDDINDDAIYTSYDFEINHIPKWNVVYLETHNDEPQYNYGFDTQLMETDHVPKWNGNICEICGFQYDPTKLVSYETKFDHRNTTDDRSHSW